MTATDSTKLRVKVSVEHIREDLANYLEAEAADKATVIAEAISASLAEFDIEAAVTKIAHQELTKLVERIAATYFKTLMESKDAHAIVIETLQAQIGLHQ